MNLKNPLVTSTILPVLATLVLGAKVHLDNPEMGWIGFGILLLLMFVIWAITSFLGEFIFYLTGRKRVQMIVIIVLQTSVIAGFSYFLYGK
ncbi:MAG: hypothetical protein ACTHJN_14760 [Ginsengibacter sp.]